MGLNFLCTLIVTGAILAPSSGVASWIGAVTTAIIPWGSGHAELTIEIGDTPVYDDAPSLESVGWGLVAIFDPSGSLKIFRETGEYIRAVDRGILFIGDGSLGYWYGRPGGDFKVGVTDVVLGKILWERQVPNNVKGCEEIDFQDTMAPGWLWGCPALYDLHGRLVRETTEWPLELGVERYRDGKVELAYPDVVYEFLATYGSRNDPPQKYVRRGDRVVGLYTYMGNEHALVWIRERKLPSKPGEPERWRLKLAGELSLPSAQERCEPALPPSPVDEYCETIEFWQGFIVGSEAEPLTLYGARLVYPGNPNAGFHIVEWTWAD